MSPPPLDLERLPRRREDELRFLLPPNGAEAAKEAATATFFFLRQPAPPTSAVSGMRR